MEFLPVIPEDRGGQVAGKCGWNGKYPARLCFQSGRKNIFYSSAWGDRWKKLVTKDDSADETGDNFTITKC